MSLSSHAERIFNTKRKQGRRGGLKEEYEVNEKGEMDGVYLRYNEENKQLELRVMYENGVKVGPYCKLYQDGTPMEWLMRKRVDWWVC